MVSGIIKAIPEKLQQETMVDIILSKLLRLQKSKVGFYSEKMSCHLPEKTRDYPGAFNFYGKLINIPVVICCDWVVIEIRELIN